MSIHQLRWNRHWALNRYREDIHWNYHQMGLRNRTEKHRLMKVKMNRTVNAVAGTMLVAA